MEKKDQFQEHFIRSLVLQIRASDPHGVLAKKSDDDLIRDYFIRERKPIADESGEALDPGENLNANEAHLPLNPHARLIFQAVAAETEKLSGIICNTIVETACDGTMRGVIYSDDRVILNKALWNSNSIYFETTKGLKKTGGNMVQNAVVKAEQVRVKNN